MLRVVDGSWDGSARVEGTDLFERRQRRRRIHPGDGEQAAAVEEAEVGNEGGGGLPAAALHVAGEQLPEPRHQPHALGHPRAVPPLALDVEIEQGAAVEQFPHEVGGILDDPPGPGVRQVRLGGREDIRPGERAVDEAPREQPRLARLQPRQELGHGFLHVVRTIGHGMLPGRWDEV